MTTDQASREYLDYLSAQVLRHVGAPAYEDLLSIMHDVRFEWFVPNDDNRIADGRDIRYDWAEENGVAVFGTDASFLEVLVGISRQLADITDESAEGWAWQLLINLGLDAYTDRVSLKDEQEIRQILDNCIERNYIQNGRGGFFPLTLPKRDQREVEIWYQMQSYVEEILPGS